MTALSTKTAALTAILVLGSLMSSSAHAGILRTAAGVPVLTEEGTPVLTEDDTLSAAAASLKAEAQNKHVIAAPPATQILDAPHERVVYFDFNKSALTKQDKHHLAHLARKLQAQHEENISIVGYADRIGNATYNEKLALKRAKAVQDFLVEEGVKAKKIEVRSLGKSAPKADCPADLPRAEMIECLKEDRRVEIEIGADK